MQREALKQRSKVACFFCALFFLCLSFRCHFLFFSVLLLFFFLLRHTMVPNASLFPPTLKPEDNQATTVSISSIVHNVTIVLLMLTIVLGITGNSVVIWVTGFKLKVDIKYIICFKYLLSLPFIFLTKAQ